MQKIALSIFILSLPLFITSCKSEEEKRAEALRMEVDQLHDELMKKSEDLEKLRRKLAETTKEAKNPIQSKAMRGLILLIDAAQSFMTDWMKMYNEPSTEEGFDKAIKYYEQQLAELKRMESQMLEVETKSKEWIEKFKKDVGE